MYLCLGSTLKVVMRDNVELIKLSACTATEDVSSSYYWNDHQGESQPSVTV